MEREPQNRYSTANEFAWDLEHLDQVAVADRAELRDWKRRRTPWLKRVLFYVGDGADSGGHLRTAAIACPPALSAAPGYRRRYVQSQ